jgi:hypothetical protein
MAGIEPKFVQLNGHDATAFILAENVKRRHLSKGQQAMAIAMAYPEPTRYRRGGNLSKVEGLASGLVSEARTVLRAAPDLAQQVMAGDLALAPAYKTTQERGTEEQKWLIRVRKLAEKDAALAEKVRAGEVEIEVAEKAVKQAADELKAQRWTATMNIVDGVLMLDREPEHAAGIIQQFDHTHAASRGEEITPKRLRRVAAYVSALADAMEEGNEEAS